MRQDVPEMGQMMIIAAQLGGADAPARTESTLREPLY